MPVQVPTADEFSSLAASNADHEKRIAALEAGAVPEPPDPPDPLPGTGVQAKRAHVLAEMQGYNTFSSMDEHNVWGSWPSDYRPETVIACFEWMYGGTGYCPPIREYHYKGRESWQTPWMQQIIAAFPDTRASLCVGVNGSEEDAQNIQRLTTELPDVWKWGEGLNEPNMDFGSGTVPPDDTVAIQVAGAGANNWMGASVVVGLPSADEYVKSYFGNDAMLQEHNAHLSYGNVHYYPPHSPDLPGDGASTLGIVGDIWDVYDEHVVQITEFHPSLYNMARDAQQMSAHGLVKRLIAKLAGRLPRPRGKKEEEDPPIPTVRAMEDIDDYYMLQHLLRAAKCGVGKVWWYALLDYGTDVYECGIFPRDQNNPRRPAYAIRWLCRIMADLGDKYGFEPGQLDLSVEGMTANCSWDLYQRSDGTFFVALWNSQNERGGAVVPVTVRLGVAASQVALWDLLDGDVPLQTVENCAEIQVPLDGGCKMLVVVP